MYEINAHNILKIVFIRTTPNPCVNFWHLNVIKICMRKDNQIIDVAAHANFNACIKMLTHKHTLLACVTHTETELSLQTKMENVKLGSLANDLYFIIKKKVGASECV